MAMNQYPLLSQKLLLTRIEDEVLILDTGSPQTFVSSAGSRWVEAQGGASHSPRSLFDSIERTLDVLLPGTRVQALVGTDILSTLDLEVDAAGGVISIGRADPAALPKGQDVVLRSGALMGLPLIDTRIGGVPMRLFFDTGCEHGYLLTLPEGGEPADILRDANPLIGTFETRSVHLPVELETRAGGRVALESCRLGEAPRHPLLDMLRGSGVDGVIGFEVLRQRKVLFRAGQQEILLTG
jgi:hypothetical protein